MNGTDIAELEDRLWSAADELRANSKLRASEYSTPVLGLIFLRYADYRFTKAKEELEGNHRVVARLGRQTIRVEVCSTFLKKHVSRL